MSPLSPSAISSSESTAHGRAAPGERAGARSMSGAKRFIAPVNAVFTLMFKPRSGPGDAPVPPRNRRQAIDLDQPLFMNPARFSGNRAVGVTFIAAADKQRETSQDGQGALGTRWGRAGGRLAPRFPVLSARRPVERRLSRPGRLAARGRAMDDALARL